MLLLQVPFHCYHQGPKVWVNKNQNWQVNRVLEYFKVDTFGHDQDIRRDYGVVLRVCSVLPAALFFSSFTCSSSTVGRNNSADWSKQPAEWQSCFCINYPQWNSAQGSFPASPAECDSKETVTWRDYVTSCVTVFIPVPCYICAHTHTHTRAIYENE